MRLDDARPSHVYRVEQLEYKNAQLEADSKMLVLMYETNSDKFIDLTMEIDEHPEEYGRACLCKTCQSYGV
jgi:hypothetical protein